jgi:hypothetical protein
MALKQRLRLLIEWPLTASLLDGTFGGPFNEARMQQIESPLTSMAHEQGWLDTDTTSNDPFGPQGSFVLQVRRQSLRHSVLIPF